MERLLIPDEQILKLCIIFYDSGEEQRKRVRPLVAKGFDQALAETFEVSWLVSAGGVRGGGRVGSERRELNCVTT